MYFSCKTSIFTCFSRKICIFHLNFNSSENSEIFFIIFVNLYDKMITFAKILKQKFTKDESNK